jgi:fatty acid synthase
MAPRQGLTLYFLLCQLPKAYTAEKLKIITSFCHGQAYYALEIAGRMKKGDTVLIHSGSGSVGQAAINICLHAGCTLYTTVGTLEKREFIKKQYPQVFGQSILMLKMYSFSS